MRWSTRKSHIDAMLMPRLAISHAHSIDVKHSDRLGGRGGLLLALGLGLGLPNNSAC